VQLRCDDASIVDTVKNASFVNLATHCTRSHAVQIALGQTVISSDGQKIGVIERVLLNPAGNVVEHFVIHHGITLQGDLVVARLEIERVDADGVHLALDAAATKQLPQFDYSFAVTETESSEFGISSPFQGTIFFPSIPPLTLEASLELIAPVERSDVDVDPEQANRTPGVVIGKGADVVTADVQRVGYVIEVEYGESGSLETVTVQTGLLRHHRLIVLAEQIAEISDEEIVLNVPAEVLPLLD